MGGNVAIYAKSAFTRSTDRQQGASVGICRRRRRKQTRADVGCAVEAGKRAAECGAHRARVTNAIGRLADKPTARFSATA